ncbi:MAG: aldehyde ferredoxin oxidoreductase family protein [Candidatus Hodarchaeota archaeon]
MSSKENIKGINGKILHIDLSKSKITVEEPESSFYRTYLGGGLLGAYYVLKHTKKGVDPLSPENVLVFSPSVVTGVAVAGISRFNVSAKSPLTNLIGDTQCGGGWGPMLKRAGFDAIVIKGKASRPVYIWIANDEVEIKDTTSVWGKVTGEAYSIIKSELGDQGKKAEIALIGPAGEKQVSFANITGGLSHFAGRTGMGAVMGSKNLKAIAVWGDQMVPVASKEGVKEIGARGVAYFKDSAFYQAFQESGTPLVVQTNNGKGNIVTRNFTSNSFEDIEQLFSNKYNEILLEGTDSCWGCPVRCKRRILQEQPYDIDPQYGGPEFETIIMLGSNLGISDLSFIGKANEICNKLGIDTISTGGMISAVMEAQHDGILSEGDTGGMKIEFGNADVALKLVEMIANQEGIGDILADGPQAAIARWGNSCEKYFIHAKNQILPAHMPRIKPSQALIYAVNPFGPDHMSSEHDWIVETDNDVSRGIGITDFTGLDSLDVAKVRGTLYSQYHYSMMDALTICAFCWAPGALFGDFKDLLDLVAAVTGWKMTMFELMKAGERRINLMRVFNAREGGSPEDDKLPERMFEPFKGGTESGGAIDRKVFDQAKIDYYNIMGWNKNTGIPTKGKLHELGLSWVIPIIYG